jgi:Spy/CpxP family protein refolding chaperone
MSVRVFLVVLFIALVPFGVSGQMMNRPPTQEQSLKVLQQELGLSDSQISRVKELVEARRERLQEIRHEARPAFEELLRLLRQPNPDPEAVGKAAIAFKQIHKQAMAEQEKSEEQFLSLLTPQQQQTVASVQSKAPLVLALHHLRLLGPEGQSEQASVH